MATRRHDGGNADRNRSVPDGNSGRHSAGQMDSGQARPPANVKLMSGGGSSINVNIHSIKGSVTVGERNIITYHDNGPPGSSRPGVYGTGRFWDRWEPDSDSSSSDDSEAERFFAQHGCQKPSKRVFRDLEKTVKNMEKMPFNKIDHVHTLVIDSSKPGQQPAAYDRNGRPVSVGPQAAGRPPMHTTNRAAGFSTSASKCPKPEPKPACAPRYSTTYEEQTEKFKSVTGQISQPHKTVDRDMIRKISGHFGQGWRRVFRHLDIPDSQIDLIFQDCGQVEDTVYRLLVEWTQRCAKPDKMTLVEALVRAEQAHIIEHLKS